MLNAVLSSTSGIFLFCNPFYFLADVLISSFSILWLFVLFHPELHNSLVAATAAISRLLVGGKQDRPQRRRASR
jgi:hypothetical protein